jgi:hypothetical protein
MPKNKFPGFKACIAMLRKRNDPDLNYEGSGWLMSRAEELLPQLIEFYESEEVEGLQGWIMEAIVHAKSPDAFDFLKKCALSGDQSVEWIALWGMEELDTKEARQFLWEYGYQKRT